MKNIYFQTSPCDEWLVLVEGKESIIMYRSQEGGLYDDEIPYYKVNLVVAVKAMLDPRYPRLPNDKTVQVLQETELGDLISQFQEGKLIYTPISMFEEWEDKKVDHLNKLVQLGELPEFAYQEESYINGKHKIAWDLMLEIFCQQANIPPRCWVQIENSSNGYEIIEVLNRKPQYKGIQVFSQPGINFECLLKIVEKGEQ